MITKSTILEYIQHNETEVVILKEIKNWEISGGEISTRGKLGNRSRAKFWQRRDLKEEMLNTRRQKGEKENWERICQGMSVSAMDEKHEGMNSVKHALLYGREGVQGEE